MTPPPPPPPSPASPLPPPSPALLHRSPWQSPVPYLFGGLAAMMTLIILALLILAFSYWKLSRAMENDAARDTDLEAAAGDGKPENNDSHSPPVFEEKFLVIMAGEAKPTFLATPTSSRTTSFGGCSCRSGSTTEDGESSPETEKEKDGSGDQVQVSTLGDRDQVL